MEAHGGAEVDDEGRMLPPPVLEQEYNRKHEMSKSGDVSRCANAIASEFFLLPDDTSKEVSLMQVRV